MKTILTISLLLIGSSVFSQNADYDWSKIIPDNGSYYHHMPFPNLVLDSSGNAYLAGAYSPAMTFGGFSLPPRLDGLGGCQGLTYHTSTRIYIAKVDNTGNVSWVVVPDANRDCGISAITYDPAGFIYVSGWSYNTGCNTDPPNPHLYFGSSTTNYIYSDFIIKLDLAGNVVWGVKYPVVNGVGIYFENKLAYKNGYLFFASEFKGNMTIGADVLSSPNNTVFVSKIDAQNGNIIWSKQTHLSGSTSINSYPWFGIVADDMGNSYLAGITEGILTMDGQSVNPGSFVLKLNPSGQCQWISSYPYLSAIDIDLSGNIYLVGHLDPTPSSSFINKTDASGNIIWTKTFTSTGSSPDYWQEVTVKSNCLYTSGYYFNSITIGNTTLTSNNWQIGYLAKLDLNGNILTASNITDNIPNTPGMRRIYELMADNSGNIYTTGQFNPNIILGSDTYIFPDLGIDNTHCYLAKFRIEPDEPGGKLCGKKFNDLNENGLFDAGEPGLPNWTITATGPVTSTSTTDIDGNYCIQDLAVGVYTVTETQQNGWRQTFPTASQGGAHSVTITGSQTQDEINFGNVCDRSVPVDLQSGLLAYYPFNGGSTDDFSGNAHHLTNNTAAHPAPDRNGSPDCAFEFDNLPASNNEFLTTTNTTFLNGLGEFSISLWYEALDTTRQWADYEVLIGRDNLGYTCPYRKGQWTIGLFECRHAIFARQNSVNQIITPGGCAAAIISHTNGWHHLVAVYNQSGQTLKIYRDGNLQNTQTGVSNLCPTVTIQDIGDLFIGKDYTGKIDDIFIHNRELSPAEVNDLYQLGSSCCSEIPLSKICGTKFNDLNGNGVRDAGEPGLPNWTITATGPVSSTGLTDSKGDFCIDSLVDGAYTIAEMQQSGWLQTFPLSFQNGTHTVTVAGGQTVGGILFGNIEDLCLSGVKEWSALGSGTNSPVWALEVSGSDIYAGGQFNTAGGVSANQIAKWDGSGWSPLGSGMTGGNIPYVFALASGGTDLYAGGQFTTAGGVNANYIAKWTGSNWTALGSGMGGTQNSVVMTLLVNGTDLYAGGDFATAGGVSANYIAKWNGSAWSALGSGMSNGGVAALAMIGTDLYAGGVFTIAGGINTGYIAKWNGSAWSALGGGMNGQVRALAVIGTDLYAGGSFTSAGGVAANNIAKWNGTSWSALGSGVSGQGETVMDLAVIGTDLYATGQFSIAGGDTVHQIAKWDGSTWSSLGGGIPGQGNALAVSGMDLYAGGSFIMANGINANHVATYSCVVPGSICGTKFNDLNGDGIQQPDEPGLPDWTITLTGNPTLTTSTDATGNYCFNYLPNGVFTVSETQQDDWMQTFPTAAQNWVHTATVIVGHTLYLNFGNHYFGNCDGTFKDIRDGNYYGYKIIGTQTWMCENLAYLPNVSPFSVVSETAQNYYVVGYNGSSVSAAIATTNYGLYGALYNWPAAMAGDPVCDTLTIGPRGICPAGWHLPGAAEWKVLVNYLGGASVAGKKMKSASGWLYNPNGTNSSGFNALPCGGMINTAEVTIGLHALYWSANDYYSTSSAGNMELTTGLDEASINYGLKSNAYSVRCVKGWGLGVSPEAVLNDVKVYPNPVTDKLMISIDSPEVKSIIVEVVSISGTIIYHNIFQTLNSLVCIVDMRNYDKGIYILKIRSDQGQKIEKIIKQ